MDRNAADSHDGHFEEDEIDLLAWLKRDGPQPELGLVDVERLRRHAANCRDCRHKVEMREEEMAAMKYLCAEAERNPGPDCPSREIWPSVAAGIIPPDSPAEHAAGCAYCGSLLRQAVADISSDATPEEMRALSKLRSSQPGMPRMMVQELAAGLATKNRPHSRARPWLLHYRWLAGAAAALVIALGVVFWLRERQMDNEELQLAQSYSAHRTMEWRFPGAAEAPVRITRGRLGSDSELPSPELLRLEARIAEQSAAHPNDPYWIMLNGRLNLLLWKYDTALQDFKRALDLRPDSASALTDLAGAYFERADATGRDSDYGTAIELLSTALQKQPHDPVALFNRGLAEERMYLYSRAAADWEELLKVEPAGGWANEARARLAEAKKKASRT